MVFFTASQKKAAGSARRLFPAHFEEKEVCKKRCRSIAQNTGVVAKQPVPRKLRRSLSFIV
jgi:hypothetical protein